MKEENLKRPFEIKISFRPPSPAQDDGEMRATILSVNPETGLEVVDHLTTIPWGEYAIREITRLIIDVFLKANAVAWKK